MAIKVNGATVITNSRRGVFRSVNPGAYETASRPPGASEGDVIYDTDEKTIFVWNGTEWVPAGTGGKTLPILDYVAISQTPGNARFEEETFELTPYYSQVGDPSPTLSITAEVSGTVKGAGTAPATGVVQSSEILNISQPEKGHYWVTLPSASIASFNSINLGNYEYGKWYSIQYNDQGFWPDARTTFASATPFTNYDSQWDTSDSTYSRTSALSGSQWVQDNKCDFNYGYTGMLHTNVLQMRIRYGHGTQNLNYVCQAFPIEGSGSVLTDQGENNPWNLVVSDGAVATFNHYIGGSDQPQGRTREVKSIAILDGRTLIYPNSISEVTISGEVTSTQTISSVTTTDVIYVDTSTVATGVGDSSSVGGVQFTGYTFDDINNPRPDGSSQRGYSSNGEFLKAFDGNPNTYHRFYANLAENEQNYNLSIRNILCRHYRGDFVSIKTQDSQRVYDGNHVDRTYNFQQSDGRVTSSSSAIKVAKQSVNNGWIENYTNDATVDWGGYANTKGASWMNDFRFDVRNNRNESSNNYWWCYGFEINGYMLRNLSNAPQLTLSGDNTYIRIGDTISPTSDPTISGVVARRDADNTITLDQVVGDWSTVTGSTITWTPPTQTVSLNEVDVIANRIRIRDCPRQPVPGQVMTGSSASVYKTKQYLQINAAGQVTGLSDTEQAFVELDDDVTPDITFPATLNGTSTDDVLGEGTTLTVTVKATNDLGSTQYPGSITP